MKTAKARIIYSRIRSSNPKEVKRVTKDELLYLINDMEETMSELSRHEEQAMSRVDFMKGRIRRLLNTIYCLSDNIKEQDFR